MRPLLGAHISIAGGLVQAIERGHELDCTTIQLFTKNASQWKERVIAPEEIAAFRAACRKSRMDPIISHGGYLVNLASPDPALYRKSVDATRAELLRCQQLGIRYLILHPGAHREASRQEGILRVIEALNGLGRDLPKCPVEILLETTAGQGTYLGGRLEEIAAIIQGVQSPTPVGLCLDTCHVFASGYDLRTTALCRKFFESVDEIIGLERLKVIHLNDSLNDIGARHDRHAHIGEGRIGKTAFRWIMNSTQLAAVAKIIETPKVDDMDRVNLKRLRGYLAKTGS